MLFVSLAFLGVTVGAGPFARDFEAARAELLRLGRSPEAIVPLFRIADLEELVPAEQFAIGLPAHPLVAAHAAWLRASDASARGRREPLDLGLIETWSVVGPFDNEGKKGFA